MMLKQEVNYHIRRCLLTLNKDFEDSQKGLDDFMDKSLKWCSQMKSNLKNEITKAKNPRKKRNGNVPPVMPAKGLGNQRVTRGTSAYVNSVINIAEAHIHIANESISCRTRGALKSLQSSVFAAGNVICNETETRQTRGRSRIRTTKAQNETIVIKRIAEEEPVGVDSISKKIKQEQLSMIETPKKNEEDVFKKPKPRAKKTKKAKESALDDAIEESITFNAVLHSSPNLNTDQNTFLLSPKNLSVIPKSPLEEVVGRTAASTSNDFINDSKAVTPKLDKVVTAEVDGGRDVNEARPVRRSSKRRSKNTEGNEKPTSSNSGNIINCEIDKKIGLLNVESEELTSTNNKKEVINRSNVKEAEKVGEGIEDDADDGNNKVVDSSESNPAVSPEKPRNSLTRPGRVIRETRSAKAAQEAETLRIKAEPETPESSTPLQDLNGTKVVPKATKRTKPVLKSRIFDSKGNILASVNSEKNSVKANSPEKPYSLRSSSSTRENFIKKEIVTPDSSDTRKAIERKQSNERRSNAENEPEVKRTKKTKRTKPKKTETSENDEGRITRTKSKKAKQAIEEAAVRKSGVVELARKSLNRAKLISLQKDQLKTMQPLAARLAHQKRQISLSKMLTGSREDLLGSANKLSLLMKNTVNLGSQVKPPKVQCLKSTESIMSTGKGKYLSLYTDPKDKFITPGKRCLSPDVMVKSTSKTTKEDEMEKELKLKALKEKEEEAQMKREMAIKMRQKELKEKNEMKLMSAMKQRKKLEMEKYNSKVQLEKEKEEKRKLLLREREMIMKEKARLKKELMEQKLAETEERRRMEEEARIAKLKEQEAEQQRLMLEKQKELERHEKRAQERLAEQKAREQYEMKLKTEQMLREKQQQLAAQSANKAAMLKGKQWNYKPRNENDLGLDDEESDLDSENENTSSKSNRPIPKWAQSVMNKDLRVKCYVKREAMMEYIKCHQKTPDIHKMFKMTPNKRIKRTSSAIWNTPSS